MNSPAQAWSKDAEVKFLESLRTRYEDQGFAFSAAPKRNDLPDFLGSYIPDAVARKPGLNIAIEVKRQQTSASQYSLQKIRRLFEGHPDWQFDVVFVGIDSEQPVTIPPAAPEAIRTSVDEVRTLNSEG